MKLSQLTQTALLSPYFFVSQQVRCIFGASLMNKKSRDAMHCVSTMLADRTRLELATPCVTGMYSNQTELPIRSLFDGAKIHFF